MMTATDGAVSGGWRLCRIWFYTERLFQAAETRMPTLSRAWKRLWKPFVDCFHVICSLNRALSERTAERGSVRERVDFPTTTKKGKIAKKPHESELRMHSRLLRKEVAACKNWCNQVRQSPTWQTKRKGWKVNAMHRADWNRESRCVFFYFFFFFVEHETLKGNKWVIQRTRYIARWKKKCNEVMLTILTWL